MKKFVAVVCLMLVSMAAVAQSSSEGAAPKKASASKGAKSPARAAAATYKLDPAQSQNIQWKSASLEVIKNTDDEVAWRMWGVGKDGKHFNQSVVAKKDGTPTAIKNAEFPGETIAYNKDGKSFQVKAPDGTTLDLTSSMSDDGKTMTVTGTAKDKDGKETPIKDVWVRQAAAKKKAS